MSKNQIRAANPKSSVWVSASAGTGKTRVLVNRILRLLLSGTEPERILCLTFTRAAAAEMSIRLNSQLSKWETMSNTLLSDSVESLTNQRPDKKVLIRAKSLFALVTESSEGIKTETLHGFCQSILRRFPIESGVPPQFRIADEKLQSELLYSVRSRIFTKARRGDDINLSNALASISAIISEYEFEKLVSEVITERKRLQNCFHLFSNVSGMINSVASKLEISDSESYQSLTNNFSNKSFFDWKKVSYIAKLCSTGTKTEKKWGDNTLLWLNSRQEIRAQTTQKYVESFFNKSGGILAHLPGKKLISLNPDLLEIFNTERERVKVFLEKTRSIKIFERTKSLIYLSFHLIEDYDFEKAQSGILDYDDQINLANKLLTNPELALWVLFKLDGGLDHILVDEAQDVSQIQWDIISSLCSEFFDNSNDGNREKTIFIVGDEKQSIFSFQGADPHIMESTRKHFRKRAISTKFKWTEIPLAKSYRSTIPILKLVDSTFNHPSTLKGVTNNYDKIGHKTVREGDSGLVEIWNTERLKKEEDKNLGWSPPIKQLSTDNSISRLALKISSQISIWVNSSDSRENGAWLISRNRRIKPSDIIILVQKRSILVDYLIKSLKSKGIPVAGVDRMILTDQLPIMDLMAAADFTLFPNDDLNLAALLKSPLIGITEDELYELAHDRGSESLWDSLCSQAEQKETLYQARNYLKNLQIKANELLPYEFFSDLLMLQDGRSRLIRRLGDEIEDSLCEFLNLAQDFQSNNPPSLQTFLHWVRNGKNEIKRDMELNSEKVRILTVHSAKGLESPIVFLADATAKPTHRPRLLWLKSQDKSEIPIWAGSKLNDTKATRSLRSEDATKQEEEYRRLLYVAMTRAEDRLYVCGTQNTKEVIPGCWYDLIANGFESLENQIGSSTGENFKRFECPQTGPLFSENSFDVKKYKKYELHSSELNTIPKIPLSEELIYPSSISYGYPKDHSPLKKTSNKALIRGQIIHRLLEFLPNKPFDKRQEIATNWLQITSPKISSIEKKTIIKSVLSILNNSDYRDYFGPETASEVKVGAWIGNKYLLGKVDRVIINNNVCTILDYKTDQNPPTSENDVSKNYLTQMAAYKSALNLALPKYSVKCGILFITNSNIVWLSSKILSRYAP